MATTSAGNLLAGRYRVLGRLGSGGMAVVMLAEDERLGRKVAVKRLHAESPDDAARRFEREAKLGASLNHPNIVAVYDIDTDDEGVLIIMEYVEGRTLRGEMDAGQMAPARAIEVLCGIAAGLDHAHKQGVVHRDVKPANVLIAERDGAVKLTDLGIATAAERTHITRSGTVLGTAAYMAPERLDGHAGGPPVDVYATAAVAFEMLSGRPVVTGRSPVEVARRVMEMPPPDLTEVVPGAPRRAAAVLKRGLAKDPAERPASAGELVRDLSGAYADDAKPTVPLRSSTAPVAAVAAAPADAAAAPPAAAPPAAPVAIARRPRRWIVPAALAAVAAIVVAILLLSGGGGGDDASPRQAAKKPAATTPKETRQQDTTPAEPAAPSGQAPAAGKPSGSPTAALSDFYERAASDDFEGAWALGTDNLHSQFGGSIDTFRGTLATLESISFPTLNVTSQSGDSATVAFTSVAHHTDRTDNCQGTAAMVASGGQWLVDHIDVQCNGDGGGAAEPAKPAKADKPPKAKPPKGPKKTK